MFFGENQGNIDETSTPTGSIHFYQPFVQFFDSNGDLINSGPRQARLLLKQTGYHNGLARIGSPSFSATISYGASGKYYPHPIKSPAAFSLLIGFAGPTGVFDGEPTISGGSITSGTADGKSSTTLGITWDGTSDVIEITIPATAP